MRAVVQRVSRARVDVGGRTVGEVGKGLLVFLGVGHDDSEKEAEFLANKIVALGGVPTTQAAPVADAPNNRVMVEEVLKAERDAVKRYTERAKQADEIGDKGLAVQLEDMVRDESGHSEETERILRDWPL